MTRLKVERVFDVLWIVVGGPLVWVFVHPLATLVLIAGVVMLAVIRERKAKAK